MLFHIKRCSTYLLFLPQASPIVDRITLNGGDRIVVVRIKYVQVLEFGRAVVASAGGARSQQRSRIRAGRFPSRIFGHCFRRRSLTYKIKCPLSRSQYNGILRGRGNGSRGLSTVRNGFPYSVLPKNMVPKFCTLLKYRTFPYQLFCRIFVLR